MRIVALFRVSTEAQASDGASLDAQERAYRELAKRQAWTTIAEFRGCESATLASTDRRVLQQVLACIRDTSPDAIYVHEQSRLTRGDELEVAILLSELRERRMKIIVGGVVRDLASIDERFMVGIQSLVDRAESERIKERMMRGRRERARQGRKTGGPTPYGYENPAAGTAGRGTLRIVEEQAAVVRRIFSIAASGKSEHSIVSILNARGIPAPRGGRWGKSTVRRVLDNPAYIGIAAANTWVPFGKCRSFRREIANERAIVVPDAHPAIIDRETWDAVRGRPKIPRTAVPRLLTGLLWVDGVRYGSDSDGRNRFYRAPRGMRGRAWLDTPTTDAEVWAAFASLATEPAFVEKLMAAASGPRDQEIAEREVAFLSDQIGKQERRLARLVDMRADGEIGKEAFVAKRDEATAAIEGLRSELAEQRCRLTALDGSQAVRVVKAVQTLLAGRTRLTTPQKRAILGTIVRRIDITAERSSADFARDAKGHIVPSEGPRWAVRSVAFRLALPAPDANGANVGETGGNGAEHALARGGSRTGHLDTTPSCLGPRAPARR